MSKYIYLAIVSIILIMSPIKVLAEDLNLDPNVLKDKGENYSSITDMYKVPIFSDKYREGIETKNKIEVEEKQELLNGLFSKDLKAEESNNSLEEKKNLLFNSTKSVNNNVEKKKSKDAKYLIVIALLIASGFIVIKTNNYYKKKIDKDGVNVYYHNIEN